MHCKINTYSAQISLQMDTVKIKLTLGIPEQTPQIPPVNYGKV